MATLIQVPNNLSDEASLRRFLGEVIIAIDSALGLRDGTTSSDTGLSGRISSIEGELTSMVKTDGSRPFTSAINYTSSISPTAYTLISKEWADTAYKPNFNENTAFNKDFGTISGTVTEGGTTTNNPLQGTIVPLNQVISGPPTQAEVQAISDKVDEILVSLQNANIIL